MADKNLWSNYTEKDTLTDKDEVMIYDSEGKTNKRSLMEKFWDYVVEKMATAVISKLETENKTVIGALNYLNGKTLNIPLQQATTEEETTDILNNLATKSNIIYIASVSLRVPYSVLDGGVYNIVGFKTSELYEWQLLISYGSQNSRIFTRAKYNGVWSTFRKI